MLPAIFLDRDGVLTKENSYVDSIQKMEIFSYAEECIRTIHEKGYLAIVVTNQSGVARGFFTEGVLREMNRFLVSVTGIDAIYFCPHHPKGIVKKYARNCDCRKPEIGMIRQAANDYSIDLESSYMVGDRASDILMGKNAGLKTVLLESGYGTRRLEFEIEPDYIKDDLMEFVKILT